MLCLDIKVAGQMMKSFQKMMIYGDLSFRISLVDQMIYFLKELMLDSPEDFLVAQYLHLLTSMIKIWHQSEITKFQVTMEGSIKPGMQVGDYTTFDLVSGREAIRNSV